MESVLVNELEKVKDGQNIGTQARAKKMVNLLAEAGLVHEQALLANQLVAHPDNRSGVLVNSYAARLGT